MFGEKDHAGLGHPWADTEAFAAETLDNPIG